MKSPYLRKINSILKFFDCNCGWAEFGNHWFKHYKPLNQSVLIEGPSLIDNALVITFCTQKEANIFRLFITMSSVHANTKTFQNILQTLSKCFGAILFNCVVSSLSKKKQDICTRVLFDILHLINFFLFGCRFTRIENDFMFCTNTWSSLCCGVTLNYLINLGSACAW